MSLTTDDIIPDAVVLRALLDHSFEADLDKGKVQIVDLIIKTMANTPIVLGDQRLLQELELIRADRLPSWRGRHFLAIMLHPDHGNHSPYVETILEQTS